MYIKVDTLSRHKDLLYWILLLTREMQLKKGTKSEGGEVSQYMQRLA